MKRLIYLILITIFIPAALLLSENKWEKVDSVNILNEDNLFYPLAYVAIDCADSLNCVAFGNFDLNDPYNRVTTDGGKTWFTTLHDSTIYQKDEHGAIIKIIYPPKVRDVEYPSKNFCIAICDSSYYWISRDNCQSWSKFKINTQYNPFSIHFLNDEVGLISEPVSLVLTKDGCKTWVRKDISFVNTNHSWSIYSSFIVNENTIYMIIYDITDKLFYFYKSFDFGVTWNNKLLNFLGGSELFFIDENRGWIAGGLKKPSSTSSYSNLVFYTSDGGETWEKQLDTLVGGKRYIHKLYFTDENTGFALTQVWNLWKTTNGGKTWVNDPLLYPGYKTDDYFTDIAPINQNKIFGVTELDRSIYIYQDDASPVQEQCSPPPNSDINIFPNPLSNEGELKFILDEPALTEVKLYDIIGNPLQTIYNGFKEDGINSIKFSAGQYSSGIYYIVINSGSKTYVEKFVKLN